MSIRITVDNNFFHHLFNVDATVKRRLIALFQQKYFAFYPQQELTLELLAMYPTMKKERARQHLQLFLEISHGSKYFSHWKEIVKTELGIDSQPILLGSADRRGFEQEFKAIVQGRPPQGVVLRLIEKTKASKQEDYEADKRFRKNFQELLKKEGLTASKITFDEFFGLDAVTRDFTELIKDFFKKENKQISDQEVEKIVNNKEKFPYLHTSWRVIVARYYRCVLDHNFGIRQGDSFDASQLIYLNRLHYLVSDDKPLKDLANLVFGDANRVKTFREFLGLSSYSDAVKSYQN